MASLKPAPARGRDPVRRTTTSGIPTFWGEADGPLSAGLSFRVGRVDETVPTAGITHLVEHLALFDVMRERTIRGNGAVGPTRTTFWVQGSVDDVREFLSTVCATLVELPLDRLDAERRVLQTESAGRGAGFLDALGHWRFGARGLGLLRYPEYALERAGPQDVQAWARSRFSAANAALWFSGRPPPRLRLHLQEGKRLAPSSPPAAVLPLPAWANDRVAGVAVSACVKRSASLTVLMRLLARRLHDRLRIELGVSYSPSGDWEPLDTRWVHIAFWADALPDNCPAVRDAMLQILNELAEEGPTREALASDLAECEKAWADPQAMSEGVVQAAYAELVGIRWESLATRRRQRLAVSAADVRRAARAVLTSALMLVPPGLDVRDPKFQLAPAWSPPRAWGSDHRSFQSTAWANSNQRRLILSPQAVSLDVAPDKAVTVSFDQCEAVLAWRDGSRTLLGSDGFRLPFRPWEWRDADVVREAIDNAIPAADVVLLGDAPAGETPTTNWGSQSPTGSSVGRLGWGPNVPRVRLGLAALGWLIVAGAIINVVNPSGGDSGSATSYVILLVAALAFALWATLSSIVTALSGRRAR